MAGASGTNGPRGPRARGALSSPSHPPSAPGDVRRIRQERSSEQITDGQYAVLAALSNRGPMTPPALAEDQQVQPPHITRVINALVAAGLARRDSHPTDRRQVVVSITDAGQAEVRETRRRRNEWLAGRIKGFD